MTVVDARGDKVKLGFLAPGATVDREEVHAARVVTFSAPVADLGVGIPLAKLAASARELEVVAANDAGLTVRGRASSVELWLEACR